MAKQEIKERVKTSEKLGFMSFSTATNIAFSFKNTYYLMFLTNVLKINIATATLILSLGTVWDAINDPLIGYISVNHTFKNGEKIRPYALYYAIPWAITVVLLFTTFELEMSVKVIICMLIYFFFEAFYTFLCMPYNSMGALATNRDDDRRSINAYRSIGGCLGNGIGAVAILPIIRLFGGLRDHKIVGPEDASALFKTALVMGVICVAGCLIHYFTSKERVKSDADNQEKISLLNSFKMLYGSKSWILNMLYIMGYGIITAIIMANISYYASYILGDVNAATPILAAYLVVSVLVSVFIGKIEGKFGRKKTSILACAVMIVGKIPFILFPYSMITIYINAITTALGETAVFIIFNTNRNNITDIMEFQYGRRIDTMVSTGDNLASKLAEAFALWIMGKGLEFAGFNTELELLQPLSAKTAICSLLGWIPALVALIMMIVAIKMDVQKEYAEKQAEYNK